MSWYTKLIGSDEPVTSPVDAANAAIAEARVAAFLTAARNALDGFAILREQEESAEIALKTWEERLGKSKTPTMRQQAQNNRDAAKQRLDAVRPIREQLEPSIEVLKHEVGKYHLQLDILTAESLAADVALLSADVRMRIAQETGDAETPLHKAMAALREAAAEAQAKASAVEEVAGL